MKRDKIVYKEFSYKIIGAAMEVHKELGCGFLESIYDEALGIELKNVGLDFKYQKELEIYYKGKRLEKRFKADYVIENSIIVENKATKGITEVDEAQMHNYLKTTGMRLGTIINYGKTSLEYKRIVK